MERDRPQSYDFSEAYQVKLLALISCHPDFLCRWRDVIKPRFFDDPVHLDVARLACDYYEKHRVGPTFDATAQAVQDLLKADPNRQKEAERYNALLSRMQRVELLEEPDITARAVDFARSQALFDAILQAADLIDKGEIGKIRPLVEDALQIGQDRQDLGLDYWEDRERFYNSRRSHTLPTDLENLDKQLLGGLANGELGIVEAPPNTGKTLTLVNFGVAALKAGADVVHYSLEGQKNNVAQRYDGVLLGTNTNIEAPPAVIDQLERMRTRVRRNLTIKAWPQNTATISMIRAHLRLLEAAGKIAPKTRRLLVIVDYGQIMACEAHYTERRYEIRRNYQDLVKLAKELNIPVWSAMQTNRQGVEKKLLTIKDLAECFDVAADADVIVAFCQTKNERSAETARLFVAKSRETPSRRYVNLVVDYDLCRLAEDADQSQPDGPEEEEDPRSGLSIQSQRLLDRRDKAAPPPDTPLVPTEPANHPATRRRPARRAANAPG